MKLSLACGPYDRARPLIDGQVKPRGIDLDLRITTNTLDRQRETVGGTHDAAEFYMGAYISDRGRARPKLGVTAIPVFLKRMFRHSYVYVNRNSAIRSPSDLAGGRVGLQSWFTTTAVWVKGIFQDDFGLDLTSVRWVSEFTESYLDVKTPPGIEIEPVPADASLHDLLVSGDLDAVITTRLWAPFGHPDITFLFEDYGAVEREYYRRTGCFPIMHVLVIRDAILDADPWVAMSLFDAWQEAKQETYRRLEWERVHKTALWYRQLWEEEQAASDGDPYRWGFRESRHEVAVLLKYAHQQGLTTRRLEPADLFHPSTLDT